MIRCRLGLVFEIVVQLRKLLVDDYLLGVCAYQGALEALDGFLQPKSETV